MNDVLLFHEKNILIYRQGEVRPYRDTLVIEVPLTVYANGQELSTLVCSPQGYKELGVGYLLNEGMISDPADIQDIHHDSNKGILFIEGKIDTSSNGNRHKRYFPEDNEKLHSSFYFAKDACQIKPVKSDFQIPAYHLGDDSVHRQFGGLVGPHAAPVPHDRHLVGDFEDLLHLVGNIDDRHALVP